MLIAFSVFKEMHQAPVATYNKIHGSPEEETSIELRDLGGADDCRPLRTPTTKARSSYLVPLIGTCIMFFIGLIILFREQASYSLPPSSSGTTSFTAESNSLGSLIPKVDDTVPHELLNPSNQLRLYGEASSESIGSQRYFAKIPRSLYTFSEESKDISYFLLVDQVVHGLGIRELYFDLGAVLSQTLFYFLRMGDRVHLRAPNVVYRGGILDRSGENLCGSPSGSECRSFASSTLFSFDILAEGGD